MGKVLITGVTGFIGSHIATLFLNEGYEVCGWDMSGRAVDGVRWKQIDLQNFEDVKNACKMAQPELIIHCAGCADVSKSVQDPQNDFSGNVKVTHNLLFALHSAGLEKCKVIFLSSAAVYGTPDVLPISEDAPLNPLSPYALHKSMAEQICTYFYKNYKIDTKIIRIFSAYGVGLNKQIFWDMYCKAKETGCLLMFGTGNESRDYIHIDDLIYAIFLLSTRAPENERIYNIANGEEVTIRRVAEVFAEQYGITKDKVMFTGVVREGDPINWRADISKLKALGYQKKIDIEDGIRDYIEWAKKLPIK